jgi:hypothetical protein
LVIWYPWRTNPYFTVSPSARIFGRAQVAQQLNA